MRRTGMSWRTLASMCAVTTVSAQHAQHEDAVGYENYGMGHSLNTNYAHSLSKDIMKYMCCEKGSVSRSRRIVWLQYELHIVS